MACYLTGDGTTSWFHLGPSLYAQAIAWVEEFRAAGEGLPTYVVESFVRSTSCPCSRSERAFATFDKYWRKVVGNCASLAVRLGRHIGEMGDIRARHVTERRARNIEDASAGPVRRIALRMSQDEGEGVGAARVRDYRGGAFVEDRRRLYSCT